MNKKEFIETLIDMGGCSAKLGTWESGWDEAISDVIEIAEKLDEPQKTTIPQFVADWIEEKLPKSSTGTNTTEDKIYIISRLGYGNGLNTDALYQGRDYEFNNKLNRDLVEYVSNNKVKVIRALIDGYEVEKEKKYYVLNNFGRTILVKLFGKQIEPSQGMKLEDLGNNNSDYQFTEQEIKNYDKRYWQFAEEVTE